MGQPRDQHVRAYLAELGFQGLLPDLGIGSTHPAPQRVRVNLDASVMGVWISRCCPLASGKSSTCVPKALNA